MGQDKSVSTALDPNIIADQVLPASKKIRSKLIELHSKTRTSHIGSCFSVVDILSVLYWGVLRIDRESPEDPDRDRLILSKGHAASALYTALAYRDLLDMETLETFHQDGSILTGHPQKGLPFIEATSGSLGHGLPIGTGIAYSLNQRKAKARVYVVLSDGEIQEGSVWEAAISAARFGLDRLTAIVDLNGLQGYERSDKIMPHDKIADKWRAFDWNVLSVNGHDHAELLNAFRAAESHQGKPTVIIARTVKGKGIKEFEDRLEWHYRSPAPEKVQDYIEEINA